MVKCKKVVDLLTEYLEGDLPSADQKSLDEHFQYCPPCVEYLHQMKKLGPLAREAAIEDAGGVPPTVAARLEDFLREQCSGIDHLLSKKPPGCGKP
ncbi:MAG: zf-HC2 domain-containing protein [Deltaproteobacteria bacterium]|nr:zf-HC2 domain-containing protein [Deltaproteobacteria bacterium]